MLTQRGASPFFVSGLPEPIDPETVRYINRRVDPLARVHWTELADLLEVFNL